jgi:YVTN family beta-propeller protein
MPERALLLLCLVLAGCQAGVTPPRMRLENEGALYLYLQPVRQDAGIPGLIVDSVAARRGDGTELQLAVALRDLAPQNTRRQRLLAAGPLPPGDYAGLTIRGRSARAASRQPPPPDEERLLAIDIRFTIRPREAEVIAVAGGQPFAAFIPEQPAVGLIGFVANNGSDDVTLFDKRTFQVFDVIATGRRPGGMALDQRARRLYVPLADTDEVEVIDIMAGKTIDRVRLTRGDEPVALALVLDGSILLSANRSSNSVSLIDTVSRVEQARIPVGSGPRFITVDRTGRRAFVFNTQSNTISVIDIASRAAVRSIPTEPGPIQGHFNRRGDRLYVVHEVGSLVTVINPLTLAPAGRHVLRTPMQAIKVDPGTDFVYLASEREFAVGLYDALSFAPVDLIDSGGGVTHMAIDGEENTLYLVSAPRDRVLVVERISKRQIGELDVGHRPVWLNVMGEQ